MAFLGPSLRRKRVTDRPAARVAVAALVSLALNVLLLLAVARLGAFEPMKLGKRERVVLQPLSADQWAANRSIAGQPRPADVRPPPASQEPAPVPPPPPREEKTPKGQVVDVAPSQDSRAPEKSRFLADRDNRVEKETRSRWQGAEVFEKRAPAPVAGAKERSRQAGGEGGDAAESREARAGGGKRGAERAPKKEAVPAPESDERLAMLERPPRRDPLGADGRAGEPSEEGLETPGAPGAGAPGATPQDGRRKIGDPRLVPSVESMSRIAAGPSNDYIDRDVEEGDATALNTRGFRFASFWNRFKQDVVGHWRPAIVYNERDPSGTMFGNRPERATELHVVLDSSGALKTVDVIESSGLDFLDREAVRAIRAAAPFYNVPAGLIDPKGEVSFSFGMVLVMNHAVPIRPRYQPGSP